MIICTILLVHTLDKNKLQDKCMSENIKSIDLGCGPDKVEGCFGVDSYQYDGNVDLVHDLNQYPWPIEDNSFDVIHARHFIEHIDDAVAFLREVHITTPHFSSAGTWGDITHVRHLSAKWHASFTRPKHYLRYKLPIFSLVSNAIEFSHPKKLRNRITKLLIKMVGLHNWERRWAFVFRGENIYTVLKIVKDNK
jgi:Methyltransferase domain